MSKNLRLILKVAVWPLVMFLAGCVNLSPEVDQTRLFVLGQTQPGQLDRNKADFNGIYITRPELPEFLKSNHLRTVEATGEVLSLPRARWAEPLDLGIARTLATYLVAEDAVFEVKHFPGPQPHDLAKLKIAFLQCDLRANGAVFVVIEWEYRPMKGPRITGQFIFDQISWVPGEAESYVATMDAVLYALLQDILSQLN